MSELGDNRLAILAAEIRDADNRSLRNAAAVAAAAIEAGHKLLEAKELVEHGKWLPWLREHCQLSERTAQRYMRIASSGLKSATVTDLGIRGAAAFAASTPPRDGEFLSWHQPLGPRQPLIEVRCWPSEQAGYFHMSRFHYEPATAETPEQAYVDTTKRPVSWPGVAMFLSYWDITCALERHEGGQPCQDVLDKHRLAILARQGGAA